MRTILVLGTTFLLIVISIAKDVSVLYPLIIGLIITGINGVVEGYRISEIWKMAFEGAKKSTIIYKLFALIGTIISVWIASGTVPGLMYYGFKMIKPGTFVLTAFLLTSMFSMILGTSFGTVSTIGIALMAVGRGFGMNPGVIAGAIISGAYLGDRSSPMSSSAILTSVVTESKLYENLKHMIATLLPGFLISVLLYYITGKVYGGGTADMTRVAQLQGELVDSFNISLIVLIPPLIIIVLSLFKVNIKINMFIGIIAGGIISVFIQKVQIYRLLYYMVFGYNNQLSSEFLSHIIKGGGIMSMVKAGLIIAVSSALNGIFEGTRMIDGILAFFTRDIKGTGKLVLKSAVASVITAMYGCSQTLSIIMTSYIMKPAFKKSNVSNTTFARTIADTSVVLSAIIPWNIAGLVPAVNMGVRVIDFIPYAYLCFILPVISILYSYMGFVKRDLPAELNCPL